MGPWGMAVLTIEGSSVAKRGWFLVALGVIGAVVVWQRSGLSPSVSLQQWKDVVALAPAPPASSSSPANEARQRPAGSEVT